MQRAYTKGRGLKHLILALSATMLFWAPTGIVWADQPEVPSRDLECCDLSAVPGVVWSGSDPVMTLQELASYCAPIVWMSPDEPLLGRDRGEALRLPTHMPFEDDPGTPVLYYRIDELEVRDGVEQTAISNLEGPRRDVRVDLSALNGLDVRYCFYYPFDVGVGGHTHDLEVVDMKVLIYRWEDWQDKPCDRCRYVISIAKVIGRAHGLRWYDNHLTVDEWTRFPIGVLVEEGKHANCPDKNTDGMYTPSFDVNNRVNDAWGVRDIIRGGMLFKGGFQGWMNKTRVDEDRVFPPLPDDSPVKSNYTVDGVYAPGNAVYTLRPLPPKELAAPYGTLVTFIESKGEPEWPFEESGTDIHDLGGWLEEEGFSKSLSVAYRYDGNHGIAFGFPFFIVKHLEDPLGGGWIAHRVYLKDVRLRDLAWLLMYAPSASRWIDSYLAAGVEWDVRDVPDDFGGTREKSEVQFVMESGFKFRVNMRYSPVKFLTKLTDFWGFRVGLKYAGNAWDFRKLGLVMEVGAGTF